MKDLLAHILCSAADSMWKRDPTLGHYRSETKQHELNLAFHFACELRNWFPASWFDCDFDVSKRGGTYRDSYGKIREHRRPDTIFHIRGTHDLNFLVVEVKRLGNAGGVEEDTSRIRKLWMQPPYLYHFGATVVMADNEAHYEVSVFARSDRDEKPATALFSDKRPRYHLPDFSKCKSRHECASLEELFGEIFSAYERALERGKIGAGPV
ncbi:MAG TPA: hypothetical protein VH619_15110 [Verrucomicrobiae bacterium]|nr:hypothetical protein [Verrucomicrobiae bacterium]